MAELDVSKTTTTNTDANVTNYSMSSQSLEFGQGDEVRITYPNAKKYFGYYKKYGQLKKAIDTLWIYVCGKGYTTDIATASKLERIRGWGEDTSHSLFWNLGVVSMVVGDSFAEIIINEKGTLINLKIISPERMTTIKGKDGMIKKYQHQLSNGSWEDIAKENILHICNDRIGDEDRGTSVIESCEWVINAIEEARTDYRKVLHRNVVPVRIIEVDTDNIAKRNALIAEYEVAIQRGEVLVVPKGTVEIKDNQISIQDPIAWIQSLESYFYIAVGIPQVIASPNALSEGSSKVSYLIFEPIYTFRQILMESDLANQVGIILKFNRPASLTDNIQDNEAKNTSQTGFQPKDMAVNMGRE